MKKDVIGFFIDKARRNKWLYEHRRAWHCLRILCGRSEPSKVVTNLESSGVAIVMLTVDSEESALAVEGEFGLNRKEIKPNTFL